MVVERGASWWADLGEPRGSAPGFYRPVIVIQTDAANRSRIQTVIVVVVMSNLALRNALGNVFLPSSESSLEKDSVINVSQLVTVDKEDLLERVGQLSFEKILEVDEGLRRILAL
jgi:mRNA interferase MazF